MLTSAIVVLILIVLSGLSFAWRRRESHVATSPAATGPGSAVIEPSLLKQAESQLIPPVQVVVNAYTDLIATNPPDPLMLEDVSELPYPKDLIRLSIQAVLKGTLNEKRQAELMASYIMLADYQEGVEFAGLDDGRSNYHEHFVPVSATGRTEDNLAASIDLVVEMGDEGDEYANIYERWQSERQQLSTDLVGLNIQ